MMGSPGAMSGAGGKGMGKAMMGALGAAGLIYAQDIADFIVGEAKNSDVTKIDIKNAATTVGISVASGATIGRYVWPQRHVGRCYFRWCLRSWSRTCGLCKRKSLGYGENVKGRQTGNPETKSSKRDGRSDGSREV